MTDNKTTEMSQEDAFELLGCGARGYARAQMRRFVRLLPDRIARIVARQRQKRLAAQEESAGVLTIHTKTLFLTEHKYEQE